MRSAAPPGVAVRLCVVSCSAGSLSAEDVEDDVDEDMWTVRGVDTEGVWRDALVDAGVGEAGAVLVRPDGHVAWVGSVSSCDESGDSPGGGVLGSSGRVGASRGGYRGCVDAMRRCLGAV